ncbi:MAG TPA: SGNH/GDSL hydrolase family protein [Ktedonobacteraceae bacterium]|nr:SGNH/GDSL hydrolase family protein [Ktedonobacteraceae bacterium]
MAIALCCVCLFFASCSSSLADNASPGTGSRQVVVQQAPRARLTYVAIGASDTFGIGADDPQTQNWPADLSAKFGSGVRLVNLGIPGVLLHQALNVEVPVALDAHPDLVTVWLAVNDLANNVPLDSYSHDLDLLVSRIQAAAPRARIAIANVPDLTLLPYFSSSDPQTLFTQIQAYNTSIATIVKRHHVILVDLYSQWSELRNHPEYISDDGLHPSTFGYTQIAELFYKTLQSTR